MKNKVTRTLIINSIIEKYNYKSYLEIGVQFGYNLDEINCEYKVGVDPWDGVSFSPELGATSKMRSRKSMAITNVMTSDFYFSDYNKLKNETFDIIFIDGAHVFSNVFRDISNSIKVLNDGGTIVLHDMLPLTEKAQLPYVQPGTWNGDSWKAFVKARQFFGSQFEFFVIDEDEGCGVIRKSNVCSALDFIPDSKLTWDNFVINKKDWMNTITYEEFQRRI